MIAHAYFSFEEESKSKVVQNKLARPVLKAPNGAAHVHMSMRRAQQLPAGQ